MCGQTPQSPTIPAVELDTTPVYDFFAKDVFSVSLMFACAETKKLIILLKFVQTYTERFHVSANGHGFSNCPNKLKHVKKKSSLISLEDNLFFVVIIGFLFAAIKKQAQI